MAQAFRFRLAPVLRMRRLVVEQRQRAVAERLTCMRELQQQSELLQRRMDEQTSAARASLAGGTLAIQQVLWDRHYLARLRREWLETHAALDQHRIGLAQERRALAEALKHRRILEKLEERQRLAHRTAQNRVERVLEDDRNTLWYVHADAAENKT